MYKKMNNYAGLRDYIISAVLVGLFFVCFIYFINNLAVDNGGRNIVTTDPVLNATFGSMTNQLNSFGNGTGTSQTQLNSTTSQTLDTSFGNMVLTSIGGAWTAFTTTVTGVYNVLTILASQKLGVPPIILNTLMGIVVVSLIFFGWRMIRLGT